MRKTVYIFLVTLGFFSCKNMSSEKSVFNEELEVAAPAKPTNISFTDVDLAGQKLQDYVDLISLKQEHPELAEELNAQIQAYTTENKLLSDSLFKNASINNLRLIEELKTDSDSITKLKLHYELHHDQGITTDSIIAIIKTKNLVVDKDTLVSKKVFFKNFSKN